jgi:hypothetical protein
MDNHMKHYALLFRSTRPLSAEELKHRTLDIAGWVKLVTDMGITLDPRNFGATEGHFFAEGGEVISKEGPGDSALTTVVFFDASSRDKAIDIARIHPGLQYGVTVELREWTSPRDTAAQR